MLNRLKMLLLKIVLWTAAISAAVTIVILTVLTVAEYQPNASETLEIVAEGSQRTIREGDRIELLTFNIGYAGMDAEMDHFSEGGEHNTPESRLKVSENIGGILEVIQGQSYDVLFLQEVDRDSRRSYSINEAEIFEKKLEGSSVFAQDHRVLFAPWPLWDPVGRVNSGIMTVTGLYIRSAQRIELPTGYKWPNRTCQAKSCLLVTRIPVEGSGRELVLINLRMDAFDDAESQIEQAQVLADFARAEYEMGNYVIVGGSFNQLSPDDDFSAYPMRSRYFYEPARVQREMFGNGWTFAEDFSGPTKRLTNEAYGKEKWWLQYYVLDGFILSPNVALEEVKTISAGFEFSDHNPVRMTVMLRAEQ